MTRCLTDCEVKQMATVSMLKYPQQVENDRELYKIDAQDAEY